MKEGRETNKLRSPNRTNPLQVKRARAWRLGEQIALFILDWHQGKSPARTCLWHHTRSSELCSLILMVLIEDNRKRVRRGRGEQHTRTQSDRGRLIAETTIRDTGRWSRIHLADDAFFLSNRHNMRLCEGGGRELMRKFSLCD